LEDEDAHSYADDNPNQFNEMNTDHHKGT
jgi:hypothetical protein